MPICLQPVTTQAAMLSAPHVIAIHHQLPPAYPILHVCRAAVPHHHYCCPEGKGREPKWPKQKADHHQSWRPQHKHLEARQVSCRNNSDAVLQQDCAKVHVAAPKTAEQIFVTGWLQLIASPSSQILGAAKQEVLAMTGMQQ